MSKVPQTEKWKTVPQNMNKKSLPADLSARRRNIFPRYHSCYRYYRSLSPIVRCQPVPSRINRFPSNGGIPVRATDIRRVLSDSAGNLHICFAPTARR